MSLNQAIDAVRGGMSQRKAAKAFGVPRSTIQDNMIRQSRTPPIRKAIHNSSNSSVLVISDIHAPYQHPDAIDFLKALKKKHKPDRVIFTGDELDYHAMSFHDSDPDLPSAAMELERGQAVLRELEALFPPSRPLRLQPRLYGVQKGESTRHTKAPDSLLS